MKRLVLTSTCLVLLGLLSTGCNKPNTSKNPQPSISQTTQSYDQQQKAIKDKVDKEQSALEARIKNEQSALEARIKKEFGLKLYFRDNQLEDVDSKLLFLYPDAKTPFDPYVLIKGKDGSLRLFKEGQSIDEESEINSLIKDLKRDFSHSIAQTFIKVQADKGLVMVRKNGDFVIANTSKPVIFDFEGENHYNPVYLRITEIKKIQ
ncbi:MAG: hypothetical protein ACRCXZ_06510 [Patescibacteria group bacterium]